VAAVEIRDLSKRFRMHRQRYPTLKERLVHLGRVPTDDFWALRDVDIAVEPGSTVALLGSNGSGKSTLLKCVAGILRPTSGTIRTRGRVAALLELGAGFSPDLTGRENVFLNGSLLGLSRREIERRFDDILDFSELHDFIDTEVRHYSSGMYVRLGFAVAVNVDPEILLVDEVLAVGDEGFQQKCLAKVSDFQAEGRTIVFVTHALDLARRVCDRAVVLDHGRLVCDGTTGEAVRTYRDLVLHHTEQSEMVDPSKPVRIDDLSFVFPDGREALLPGDALTVAVHYEVRAPIDDLAFGISIFDDGGFHLYGCDTTILGVDPPAELGVHRAEFRFSAIPLLEGRYYVSVRARDRARTVFYDRKEQRVHFDVLSPGRTTGLVALPLDATFSTPERPGRR
jgi:ABC-2 type transport system ATP-binding protein